MSCPNPLLVSLYGSPNVAFLAEDELELQIPPTIPRNGLFAFLKEQLRDLSNVLLGFLLTTTNLCNHANNTCLVNSSYRSWRSTLLNVMWLYVIPGILSAVPLSKECFGLICLGYTLYTAARSTIVRQSSNKNSWTQCDHLPGFQDLVGSRWHRYWRTTTNGRTSPNHARNGTYNWNYIAPTWRF